MFDPENTANQKYIYKQNLGAMEEEKSWYGELCNKKRGIICLQVSTILNSVLCSDQHCDFCQYVPAQGYLNNLTVLLFALPVVYLYNAPPLPHTTALALSSEQQSV
jgi:hypothetical protein